MSCHALLKEHHRSIRGDMPQALNMRIHRALSWLHRAEQCDNDTDGKFIFLWIAFNSAYAQELPREQRLSTQLTFTEFLARLHREDAEKHLDWLVWKEFSGTIRRLLDTPYVFESFWAFHRGHIGEDSWKERFAKGQQRAARLLSKGDTPELLALVLQRIYTARNQLMHGGATWNSAINRQHVQDCCDIMEKLVPLLITIMMGSSETDWGETCYPVVENAVA